MKQRSDYTFKYNVKIGRHGWLRLTPAYSIKLVREILCQNSLFESKACKGGNILDPFCGTATTGIVAAEMGWDCILYDINPFLVWFGNIKSENFENSELNELYRLIQSDLPRALPSDERLWIPPMKNIERWWNANTLKILSALRHYICERYGYPTSKGVHNLLWVAFARLVIETSAADFSHISVSFQEETTVYNSSAIIKLYLNILEMIIRSAAVKLEGNATIICGDSKLLERENHKFDLVITSPPYPNRISYIRELRPYMYWLGFLETGEQAGELDWKAIGGTWGAATSKLYSWTNINTDLPAVLFEVCSKIEHADNKNGKAMSLYVLKFFDDMFTHLSNLRKRLNRGAEINYILGNSSFYGNYVDTDGIIKEILHILGYSGIISDIIRKRNSNKGLFEYKISAKWQN